MSTSRGRSPTPLNQTHRSGGNNSKNSTKYNFRIQSAPPLSLQQFLRSATGVIAGAKEWQHSGKYCEPVYHAYLSPEVREQKKKVEPVWRPQGQYREKPPTSLSPERIIKEKKPEPVWHPPGKYQEKPVPYFDPPSLRWSLQDLLRSMPEMRPKTFRSSSSMSSVRKTKEVQDT